MPSDAHPAGAVPGTIREVCPTCVSANKRDARDQQDLRDVLQDYLIKQFGCHTAILYGSRSREDWDAASDIDILAFSDAGRAGHVTHRWNDLFLDLFLYPTATSPTPDWIRLDDGRVLFQRGSAGDDVLVTVKGMLAAGPERLSSDEVQTRRLWIEKMLARAERGDSEGHYRRHWLLMTLLEDYFALRGQWYLGPRRGLAYLQREKPADFAVLRNAFDPSASIADIQAAAATVIRIQDF